MGGAGSFIKEFTRLLIVGLNSAAKKTLFFNKQKQIV